MLADGVYLLTQIDLHGAVILFWFAILFEIPRYAIGGLIMAVAAFLDRRPGPPRAPGLPAAPGERVGEAGRSVSVVVVGHNEARTLPACIASIREQTLASGIMGIEVVVVSDGSTDEMTRVGARLQEQGAIDTMLSLDRRGGKSAAVNLALEYCTGDIVIIVDVDTSFGRHAFAALTAPFADPAVGAVAGNLGVRNAMATLLTRCQAVEYLIGVSLGRRLLSSLDILFLVSGAMGAFRRSAAESVGGLSVEVGEDADLTAKLRRAGWKIRFAPDAWGLTDVPATLPALIRQRMRWERSIITIYLRKFRSLFDPRQASFSLLEVVAVLDIVFFQVGLSAAFALYLGWLFWNFGALAWIVLTAATSIYIVLAYLSYLLALSVSGGYGRPELLPQVFVYAFLNAFLLRFVRLAAYLDELLFRRSYRDPFVPAHVLRQVERF